MKQNRDRLNQYLILLGQGDISALGLVYEDTYQPLYFLCYSYLKNKEDSEDALSETYLTAHRNIAKFSGENGFNWLYSIAKNTCLNMLKRQKHVELVDFQDEETVNALHLEYAPPEVEDNEMVELAKATLDDLEFQILLLHAVGDRKFKEIAKIVGRVEATVRWQYNNALKKVRKEYERRNHG